jgi:hypothetical protein
MLRGVVDASDGLVTGDRKRNADCDAYAKRNR